MGSSISYWEGHLAQVTDAALAAHERAAAFERWAALCPTQKGADFNVQVELRRYELRQSCRALQNELLGVLRMAAMVAAAMELEDVAEAEKPA